MTVEISVETNGLQLISSGFILATPKAPVWMHVFIEDEQIVSVAVFIHNKVHPDGKSMDRRTSEDGNIDEWHIYESDDGELGYTPSPVRIISYEYEEEEVVPTKTLFLQLHTKKLKVNNLYKIEYIWLEGDSGKLPVEI